MRMDVDEFWRGAFELTLQFLRGVNDFCAVAKDPRGKLSG
jgi:hypothetical protein